MSKNSENRQYSCNTGTCKFFLLVTIPNQRTSSVDIVFIVLKIPWQNLKSHFGTPEVLWNSRHTCCISEMPKNRTWWLWGMAGINRDLILYDPCREQVPDSEEILAPRLWNKCAMYSASCLYTEISYASNCRSSQRVFRPIPNTTINTLLNSHLTITHNATWLDMNEDGDCKLLVLAPSQMHTRRYTCLVLVQSVLVIRMKCVELIMKGWNTKALSCEAKGKAVLHLQLKRNPKKKKKLI